MLLNSGKVLNLPQVDKLITFEAMKDAEYRVFIKVLGEPPLLS